MKSITAFQASDGTLFASETDAEKHDVILSMKHLIESFLDSDLNPYRGHAHRAIVRLTTINWELWKVKNDVIIE